MVDGWTLLLVGFFTVAIGYVWLRHVVDAQIEAAIAEQTERLDRLERRLDALEAADEGE